ncbi:uncharacterized protein EV422DRAFT_528335 [Fimicolochytrium jonesii]|uniref:uncharacterized protein n=1 Tax=Fimicolochytrium jonesii TaxID=1396493 RepID=UPI0022FECCC5|nr:uncharacterized protein EV422DRAFT_528335 [Fimicolochytrium jonesii]KAI8821501.1 hypothetical protein EV422DRAFT_528335 [Fimicolochytrium jonesii]
MLSGTDANPLFDATPTTDQPTTQAQADASQTHQQQHQSAAAQKPLFSAKHPLGKFQKSGSQFRSPTDNLMSPATKKVEAKRNHLLTKIKPKSLASQFSQAAKDEDPTTPK